MWGREPTTVPQLQLVRTSPDGMVVCASRAESNMMDLARKSQDIWVDPYGDGETACYLTAGMTGLRRPPKIPELSDDAVTMESSLRRAS